MRACGSRVPWGVRFGGPENCRFRKDFALQPVTGARGCCIDLGSAELLRLGLQLDRQLERHVRCPRLPVRPHVQLPKLWTGFRGADAATITGDGPELAAYAQRIGRPPQQVLRHLRREYFGLMLYPLSWVSHHWQQAVAVFADLERFPRRQVFALHDAQRDLMGFQDAAEFDFVGSRFRSHRRRKARCPVLAAG